LLEYLKLLPDLLFQPLKVRHLPPHVQLESTTACNLNCITCPRASLIEKPRTMSFQSFKRVYDQIRPSRMNLSGLGEPLANADIFRISSYASDGGTLVNLPTNFSLAGGLLGKIIDSGISQFKVSIDAATRDTYLKTRGCDLFEEIVGSIEKLNAMKAEAGVRRPEVRFNFAVQKENIDELVDIIHLASRLDVRVVYYQQLEFIDLEDRKPALVGGLNSETLSKHLAAASEAARAKGIETNLKTWVRDLALYANKIESVGRFESNTRTCYFPWFSTYIEVNGDVRPCPHFMFRQNEGIMGNVFEQRFEQIWNGRAYREVRRELRAHRRPFAPCETCIPQKLSGLVHVLSKLLPKA
jgi:radical SAM protein with 4Fe4S-binding SPASM domain